MNFDTNTQLEPNDIDKIAEYIENKGYEKEEKIELPKDKSYSNEFFLYGYKCPLCGYKNTFENSLIFDRWIKNHNCKKERDN